jgi:hypothetical protein
MMLLLSIKPRPLSFQRMVRQTGQQQPTAPNENKIIPSYGPAFWRLPVVSSPMSDPMVHAGKLNRVCVNPVLGSGVQARQTWTCVYIADRELGTANDAKRGYESYDEAADHFSKANA